MRMDASDAATGERIVMSRSGDTSRCAGGRAAMARAQARRTEWLSSSSATGKGERFRGARLAAHRARAAGDASNMAILRSKPLHQSGRAAAAAAVSVSEPLSRHADAARSREQGRPPSARLHRRYRAEGGSIAPDTMPVPSSAARAARRWAGAPSPDDNSIARSRPARGPPNPRSPGRATSRPFFLLSVCDRTALAYSQNNHNAQRASRRSGLVDRGGPRPERRAGGSRVARRPVAAAAAPAPARARLNCAHDLHTH